MEINSGIKKNELRETDIDAVMLPILGQYVSGTNNGGGCIIDPADPALTKQNAISLGCQPTRI